MASTDGLDAELAQLLESTRPGGGPWERQHVVRSGHWYVSFIEDPPETVEAVPTVPRRRMASSERLEILALVDVIVTAVKRMVDSLDDQS